MFTRFIALFALSLVIAFAVKSEAKLPDVSPEVKAKLDSEARQADFKDADYPLYVKCNGCGPDGAPVWLGKIANRPPMFPGLDLTEPCNQHDIGYATLGLPKRTVDIRFRANLQREVNRYIITHRELSYVQRRDLRNLADVYYKAVDKYGAAPYKEAQEQQKKYENWVNTNLSRIISSVDKARTKPDEQPKKAPEQEGQKPGDTVPPTPPKLPTPPVSPTPPVPTIPLVPTIPAIPPIPDIPAL